jgi:hypothetical protein
MSKEALEQVVLKASSDARFRTELTDNFDAAIRPYDLTDEEKDQLRQGQVGVADPELSRSLAASHTSTLADTATSTMADTATSTLADTATTTVAATETASTLTN